MLGRPELCSQDRQRRDRAGNRASFRQRLVIAFKKSIPCKCYGVSSDFLYLRIMYKIAPVPFCNLLLPLYGAHTKKYFLAEMPFSTTLLKQHLDRTARILNRDVGWRLCLSHSELRSAWQIGRTAVKFSATRVCPQGGHLSSSMTLTEN